MHRSAIFQKGYNDAQHCMADIISEYGSIEAFYAEEITSASDDPLNTECAYSHFAGKDADMSRLKKDRSFRPYLLGWNAYLADWRKSAVHVC